MLGDKVKFIRFEGRILVDFHSLPDVFTLCLYFTSVKCQCLCEKCVLYKKFPYYAGIMLDAFLILLCSKLCWHNWLKPMSHSSKFSTMLYGINMTYFIAINNCIIPVGFVTFSVLVLYSYIWLVYILHLALKLFFPLKSAKFFNSGYSRAIYITEFLIVILIGTVPSTISAVHSRYRISIFPPIHCGGHIDPTYIFYLITLPILAAVCVSLILMILILYKVHMVSLIT